MSTEKKKFKEKRILDKISLEFEPKIEKKILSDEIFMKFIKRIEIAINKFVNLNNLELKNKIYFEKDFEIPDLDKLILSIQIEDLSVQEKLDVWDEIDGFIRKNIQDLIKFSSEKEIIEFKNLNQKLFTSVEII